jgi:hypothetical protein
MTDQGRIVAKVEAVGEFEFGHPLTFFVGVVFRDPMLHGSNATFFSGVAAARPVRGRGIFPHSTRE